MFLICKRQEWYVTDYTPLNEEQRKEVYETTDWLYPELKKRSEENS
jgi:hypothetical protein